jgi:DNA-binding CsgD family transcriptional regulator
MSSYFAAQLMACYMYVAAARRLNAQRPLQSPRLSARERECLELAAHGKSDWAAGMLLGISERTVHNHIESAKRRLGVATRVQAIVRALTTGQISLGDVVRADRDA